MIMKMRGDKCHPGRGKRVKIPLLPNIVGKKNVNDAGPQQSHNSMVINHSFMTPLSIICTCLLFRYPAISFLERVMNQETGY